MGAMAAGVCGCRDARCPMDLLVRFVAGDKTLCTCFYGLLPIQSLLYTELLVLVAWCIGDFQEVDLDTCHGDRRSETLGRSARETSLATAGFTLHFYTLTCFTFPFEQCAETVEIFLKNCTAASARIYIRICLSITVFLGMDDEAGGQ